MNIRLLKMDDVAQMLGVSKSFAYELTRKGRIPAVRLGRSVRIRPEDLEKFVSESLTGSPQKEKAEQSDIEKSA